MATVAFPTLSRGPNAASMNLVANTAVFRSPLSGVTQTLARPGSRLTMMLTWSRISGDDRAILKGFLAGQFGQEHLITYRDPTHVQRGALGGSPTVAGASQTGQSLDISSGPVSQTNWLRRGDQISFPNGTYTELKIVTDDVDTNGSGQATIPIYPEIHISPANLAAVDIVVPINGTWRLLNPENSWDDEPGDRSTFNIELEEYI
jgi:hypothetical protein